MMCRALILKLLKKPPVYCAVVNRYVEPESSNYLRRLGYQKLQGLPFGCYTRKNSTGGLTNGNTIPPSPQSNQKLLYYYTMDLASLYPVLALDVHPSDTILDMCAAPGGKAFLMLQIMSSEDGGAMALNDFNTSRVKRLKDVVHRCVGKDFKQSIRITRRKGEDWGKIEESAYRRVLIDAPCSTDRHRLEHWEAKKKFYPDTKKYATLQHDLLLAGLHTAEDGGTVVYSTCTMSTHENDEVVHRVIESARKFGYRVTTTTTALPTPAATCIEEEADFEETVYGRLILPSLQLNIGPMYVSKLCLTKR